MPLAPLKRGGEAAPVPPKATAIYVLKPNESDGSLKLKQGWPVRVVGPEDTTHPQLDGKAPTLTL